LKSRLSQFASGIGWFAYAIVFSTAGFVLAAQPILSAIKELQGQAAGKGDTWTLNSQIKDANTVERVIENHPLTAELRESANLTELRSPLKMPRIFRRHSLTAGTLAGPGNAEMVPFTWTEKGGRSLTSIHYIGNDLCGHRGVVHGGYIATLLDEGLAACCFVALPHHAGVTAKLEINYKNPIPSGSYVVLRAKTTKIDGRKAWVVGSLETLPIDGEPSVTLVEASGLFVSPRQAAVGSLLHAEYRSTNKYLDDTPTLFC
jgi:3'-phosphoadenosine 5'-phosphosulfate synthase